VTQFIEVAHQRHLTVYVDAKEDLVPTLSYPSSLKRKAVVFLKKQELGGLTLDQLNNVRSISCSSLTRFFLIFLTLGG